MGAGGTATSSKQLRLPRHLHHRPGFETQPEGGARSSRTSSAIVDHRQAPAARSGPLTRPSSTRAESGSLSLDHQLEEGQYWTRIHYDQGGPWRSAGRGRWTIGLVRRPQTAAYMIHYDQGGPWRSAGAGRGHRTTEPGARTPNCHTLVPLSRSQASRSWITHHTWDEITEMPAQGP